MTSTILHGDCLEVLPMLVAESVQCVVTSPPYYGLRDYGTAFWDGGDPECRHASRAHRAQDKETGTGRLRDKPFQVCRCGASRIDQQIGMEKSPQEYVDQLVAVFREVKRVLRNDGTVWLNLGSSFASKRVESQRWIVRRDLSDEKRAAVAKAMSTVWAGYALPEQAMQSMLDTGECQTRELPRPSVRQMRRSIQCSQDAGGGGKRELLLSEMREVWEPDPQAPAGDHSLHDMRDAAGEIPCRYAQEQNEDGVLQQRLLVQLQSEGQSLPVGRRAGRENEPRRSCLAKGGADARQVSLPAMPCDQQAGSTSYPAVQESHGRTLECGQWADSLPIVPSQPRPGRNRGGEGASISGGTATSNLAGLAFDRSVIPAEFLPWCEPEHVIKPKDDIQIPARVALALCADGWYLRSEIIWSKSQPMPESVRDRPTCAHEKVFLLTKSASYFYDADAVREPFADDRKGSSGTKSWDYTNGAGRNGDEGLGKPNPYDGRNLRNVWHLSSEPSGIATHFAKMPMTLAERCIKAGSRPGDTVLDPFAGSGTSLLVADRLQRHGVGIELNVEYIELSRARITSDAPLFTEVA